MTRRRWFIRIVLKSLVFRPGRSLLLLGVLVMAASLVTALGMVSSAMEGRVVEEVRKYGANLVISPAEARIAVGSGTLGFGSLAEPVYLPREEIRQAVQKAGIDACSFHLRGELIVAGSTVPAEGVDFRSIRTLYSWWQLQGGWPAGDEVVIGTDLATRLKVRAGDRLRLRGRTDAMEFRVSALVATGGEEDALLFVPLERLQELMGVGDSVTEARLLARTGAVSLERQAVNLQQLLPGSRVREVRQVARTSEGLLRKVQLLMALVTGVVVIASASSVASTMSMTVLERGKEIGLLKAVGGSRREVLALFAAEALTLGLMGGGGGFLCGSLIAAFVMRSVFASAAGFAPIYLLPALLAGLLIALGGSLGAMLAVFRLDPVRSLRGE